MTAPPSLLARQATCANLQDRSTRPRRRETAAERCRVWPYRFVSSIAAQWRVAEGGNGREKGRPWLKSRRNLRKQGPVPTGRGDSVECCCRHENRAGLWAQHPPEFPVVSVAQLVEHRSVAPRVAGSNPVAHPKTSNSPYLLRRVGFRAQQFFQLWSRHPLDFGHGR